MYRSLEVTASTTGNDLRRFLEENGNPSPPEFMSWLTDISDDQRLQPIMESHGMVFSETRADGNPSHAQFWIPFKIKS